MPQPFRYLLVALLVVSCDARDSGSPNVSDDSQALAGAITNLLATRHVTPACGSESVSASPAIVLTLTSKQCLSCQRVGYLARRLQERKRDGAIALAMPTRDTQEVCDFLHRERVGLPAFAFDPPASLQFGYQRHFLFMRYRQNWVLDTVQMADSAHILLASLLDSADAVPDSSFTH